MDKMKKECPNMANCQIINEKGFVPDEQIKQQYVSHYCIAGEENFSICKRYQTKQTLGFCPDFVFPDSTYNIDEIMEKCEQ